MAYYLCKENVYRINSNDERKNKEMDSSNLVPEFI
jgi:hypothetical protein